MQEPSVLGCEIQLWETKSKKFWSHELPKRFTTRFEGLWTVLNGFLRGHFKSGQVALQIVINRLKNKDLIIETCDHLTFRCIEKFWTFTHFFCLKTRHFGLLSEVLEHRCEVARKDSFYMIFALLVTTNSFNLSHQMVGLSSEAMPKQRCGAQHYFLSSCTFHSLDFQFA